MFALKLIASLAILMPISIAIHEAGHWLTGYFVYGNPGHFELFSNDAVARCVLSGTNSGPLFYYSGGFFAALVLSILYLFVRRKIWQEVKMVWFLCIAIHFSYGIWEGNNRYYENNFGVWLLGTALIIIISANYISYYISYYNKLLDTRKEGATCHSL